MTSETRERLRHLIDARRRQLLDRSLPHATHCDHCGQPLKKPQSRQRFCSKTCRQRHWGPHHKAAFHARKKAAK
jgi:hypothetical protein